MATKKTKNDEIIEHKPDVADAAMGSSEQPRNGKNLLFWFVAFVLVVAVFGFLGYKFLLGDQDISAPSALQEPAVLPQSKPEIAETLIKQQKKTELEHNDLQFGEEIMQTQIEQDEEKILENTQDLTTELANEIGDKIANQQVAEKLPDLITPKITQLQNQQQNLLLYITAKNIQLIINQIFLDKIDENALQDELDFFKKIAGNDAEYQGKIDIITYSLEGGLPSANELLDELDVLAKKLEKADEKTFWQNLQDSIFGLIKVTKLDEKAQGDYPKILLAKKALQQKDFNEAIRLIDAIDDKALETWLDKAYKLQRVQESASYLLGITRKKLVQ